VPIARAESTCPTGLSRGEPWIAKQYRETSGKTANRLAQRNVAPRDEDGSRKVAGISRASPPLSPLHLRYDFLRREPEAAKVPYLFAGVFFFFSDSRTLIRVCSMSSIYCSTLTTKRAHDARIRAQKRGILNSESLTIVISRDGHRIVRRKRKAKGTSRVLSLQDFSFVRIAESGRTFAAYISSSAEFSPSSGQPFLVLTCRSQFSICSHRIKSDCAARCAVAVKSQSKLRAPVNAQWP